MIRLICIDLDGTLIGSSGRPSLAVLAAADDARVRGTRLAVCTGRPGFGLAREFAERLQPDGWHIFQNGASVVDLARGDTRSSPLPAAPLAALIARSRALARPLELYGDHEYWIEIDSRRSRAHACLLGVPYQLRSLDDVTAPIVRAQWLVARSDVGAILAEPAEGLSVSDSTSPVMPDSSFVNVTAAGVDKASALRTVASALGVHMTEVMMVGDGGNDVGAMQVAGVAVAMGNADPACKAVARHTVGDVDADGLVEAFAIAAGQP